MSSQKMGSSGEFDTETIIENLTVNNIRDVSFKDMLSILGPLVLVQLPEDTDDLESKRRYDYLLARLANLYAYLRVLWAAASYERSRARRIDSDNAEEMQKKKEALFEIGNAVKLKYEAVSRKITLALNDEKETPERVDYEGRREQLKKEPPKKRSTWDSI